MGVDRAAIYRHTHMREGRDGVGMDRAAICAHRRHGWTHTHKHMRYLHTHHPHMREGEGVGRVGCCLETHT